MKKTSNIRETEHPLGMPHLNRDYDPILRQWTHPPPRWLWWYARKGGRTKADTIAGIVGGAMLAAACWAYVAWFF